MKSINGRSGLRAAWLRGGLPLLALCLIATGATCDKSKGANPFTGPGANLGRVTVKDVAVTGPNQVRITTEGPAEKAYPFSLTDPLRIGVDIKDAELASAAAPIPGSGIIDRVEVVPSAKPAHVKVVAFVRQNATYKMDKKGNEIILTVEPKAGSNNPAASAAGASTIPYKETKSELERQLKGAPPSPYSDLSSGDASSYSASAGSYSSSPTTGPFLVSPMPAPNPDGTANVVGDVFYRTIRGGVQIMIYTNGTVKDVSEHADSSPPRIVLELKGVRSTAKHSYPLAYAGVSRIRVDAGGGGTTVNIDLSRGLQPYEVHRTSSGVVVTVFQ